MKKIIALLSFLIVAVSAFSQPWVGTNSKTRFNRGIAMGCADTTIYVNASDTMYMIFNCEDSSVRVKFKGFHRTLAFVDNLKDSIVWGNIQGSLNNQTDLRDTLLGKVRLQTGNLFRQDGKIWVSDTIRTSGLLLGERLSVSSATSVQAVNAVNSSTGRAGSFTAATGIGVNIQNSSTTNPALRVVQDDSYRIIELINSFSNRLYVDTAMDINIQNAKSAFTGKLTVPSISDNRTWTLPNASGTLALTSQITDSSSALRASINTKLNISDAAATYATIGRLTDTASALRSSINTKLNISDFNTTGDARYLQLTGGTLTGALSGTTAGFTTSVNGENSLNYVNTNSGTSAVSNINLTTDATTSQFVYTSSAYSGAYTGLGVNTLAIINRSTTGGGIKFITGGFADAGTRMTITTSGNVGIGTTAPNASLVVNSGALLVNTNTNNGTDALQVAGSVSATGRFYSQGTGFNTTSSAELFLKNTTSSTGREWVLNSANSGVFQIADNTASGATRFSIDNTGAATFSSSVKATYFSESYTSVSTTYTVADNIGTVYASSNTYTITLPSASSFPGRIITIKRTSSGLGTSITISGVTLGTSENGGSLPCHGAATYKSDGSNWYVISYHAGGCD